MSALVRWLTPDVLHTMGLSLLHFLWQGAALAIVAMAGLAAARTAAARYVVAMGVLMLMMAAPVATYMVLSHNAATGESVAGAAMPAISHAIQSTSQRALTAATTSQISYNTLLTLLVELWFAGVILFSLRTAGGFLVIARLRRRDSTPIGAKTMELCVAIQQRLKIDRAIRYCESLHLDAPAVIGWFRPVVLLPVSALTGLSELQLRAIVAHELAHIRRFDSFCNLFQVLAETVLFYHPAVWWLNQRIRSERENCCDDVALAVCGQPAEYARALAMMEEWRTAPAFAMAANRGPLSTRVARLLGVTQKGSSLRSAGLVFAALCLTAALLAGNALFGLVRGAAAKVPGQSPAQTAPAAPEHREHPIVITAPRPAPAPEAQPAIPASSPSAPTPPTIAGPTLAGQDAPKQSYIDSMKAEGFDHLSADDLIAMKIQGITPQYIHEIRAEGLKPNPDELIGMKVQGITPEYIRQIRALKLNADVDSLIGMKVQGITPEYVDSMRKLGFQPDADQLIGMKVQGITPEYVEGMRKLGYQADADQIIGMKVQGITPEYVRQLNELNIHPDADELIGMKVQGIEANYVRSIRSTGLNPDKDEWIGLKVQGVTEEFIKSLQAAGFKPSVDEVIGAKVMGITPQFIEKARSHGFKNLDLDKLIQLKHANVLE